MAKFCVDGEFFNPTDTLECGQVFRYKKIENAAGNCGGGCYGSRDGGFYDDCGGFSGSRGGCHSNAYYVFSGDKACLIYSDGGKTGKVKTAVECLNGDEDYFYNYFDLSRDYSQIYGRAANSEFEILKKAATAGKGVRILNQDRAEALLSFIISQNNNIPRIQKTIEKLCAAAGEKREFNGVKYYSFPTVSQLAGKTSDFYKSLGFGYRDGYMCEAVKILNGDFFKTIENKSGAELKKSLLSIKGVGEKVADCALLFGFHDTGSFPVDVWLEKVYKQDFKGELTDRKKITEYFTSLFGDDSGYFQQYLFYYKRSLEKTQKV
ncbi:MAG: DNA glycosylase [Candidatus Borkfalkiaceae bacterium]|nr:DNA glycosylase [Christensenellaceae bacterium]